MAKLPTSKEEIIQEVLAYAAREVAKRAAGYYIDNRMQVSDELRVKLLQQVGSGSDSMLSNAPITPTVSLTDEEINTVAEQLANNLSNDLSNALGKSSLAAKSELANAQQATDQPNLSRNRSEESDRMIGGLSENGDDAAQPSSVSNPKNEAFGPSANPSGSSIYNDPDVGTAASEIPQSQSGPSNNNDSGGRQGSQSDSKQTGSSSRANTGSNRADEQQGPMTQEQQLSELESEADPAKQSLMAADSHGLNAPNIPGSSFMHRRHTVNEMQHAVDEHIGSGGLKQAVLTKLGGHLLFTKAEQIGEKLKHNIKTGKFESFIYALLIAIIKDLCDFLFDAETLGLVGTILSIFVGIILYSILFNEGTWFKRWIIKRYFWGMIATQLAEFLPGADFFPWYSISILIMEYNNVRDLQKQKSAYKKVEKHIKELKKRLARGKEIKPRILARIQKELDALDRFSNA